MPALIAQSRDTGERPSVVDNTQVLYKRIFPYLLFTALYSNIIQMEILYISNHCLNLMPLIPNDTDF